MNKKVLVTGAAGYIGSVLVRMLLNQGYGVRGFDILNFGEASLSGVYSHPRFEFIKGDIKKEKDIEAAVKGVWAIVHLAAIVGDPACAKQPELAVKTNYNATINLLNWALKHKVKRFIFASTCSNYGKMSGLSDYVDETSPLAPVSLYAELKVKSEKAIMEKQNKKDDFHPVILRFATVYGVSPRMRFDLTVNEFTKELALGRELVVFGEQFWRPYCHVSDIGMAIEKVLQADSEKISGNIFNVGDTAENYQKQMIVDEIKKIIPEARVKYVRKEEDPRDYRVSFKKIKNELDFTISRRLLDGIREVKSIIDNKVLPDPDDAQYRNA